jgi:hypothetical protein
VLQWRGLDRGVPDGSCPYLAQNPCSAPNFVPDELELTLGLSLSLLAQHRNPQPPPPHAPILPLTFSVSRKTAIYLRLTSRPSHLLLNSTLHLYIYIYIPTQLTPRATHHCIAI